MRNVKKMYKHLPWAKIEPTTAIASSYGLNCLKYVLTKSICIKISYHDVSLGFTSKLL